MDLGDAIFQDEIVSEAWFRDELLQHGVIIERNTDQGRPSGGEYRPEVRAGSGNHAIIFLRSVEGVLAGREKPMVKEKIRVYSETSEWADWTIRSVKGPEAGIYDLLCVLDGSRAISSDKRVPKGD